MRQFSQEELVEKIRSERCHIGELYDEINTLKRENANLKDYVKSLKDECISCPENKKNIKQAQIDVLNKLKDSYGLYYLSAFGVKERMLADILNPMIEELKK